MLETLSHNGVVVSCPDCTIVHFVAAYRKDAEPLQGMQQQTTLLSRAGEEPPEGSQNLELVGSNVKTFEEELTWETFEDDET